jgi:peptide/nickel transport system permease protein
VLFGARVSLTVGLLAVALGATVGVTLGLVAGYLGGQVDNVTMRLMEVVLAFPGILLAILIVAILGPGLFNVLIALSVFALPDMSRIARGSALSLKAQDFVMAARAGGASDARIIIRHILPNALSPLIVITTLRVAYVILAASSLSFIGLGAQPPTPEWGAMISEGRFNLQEAPHIMLFPGLAILITVLSLNFMGDALRDALDPRMRAR